MKVIVGKFGGFCSGVFHTVNMANKLIEENNSLYSLGELVHNEIVINNLENKGLITVNNIEDIPNNSKVIFRAHGEPISSYNKALEKNLEVIDLTCPKVRIIHDKIKINNDKYIIVIGKKNHPETIGHIGYANDGIVIESIDDIKNINTSKDIFIVVQTTFNEELFNNIVSLIKEEYSNVIVNNTICDITHKRQLEVVDIAKDVNRMIIVGGKNSSNTRELANIAKEYIDDVLLVQNIDDLKDVDFSNIEKVGIMGGASTPKEIIDEIYLLLVNK